MRSMICRNPRCRQEFSISNDAGPKVNCPICGEEHDVAEHEASNG